MSEIKVDVVSPYTGTGLQIGESGDTVTVITVFPSLVFVID